MATKSRTKSDIHRIILHCSDSEFGSKKIIDGWHRERGWSGIGYHYVINNGHPVSIHRKGFDQEWDGKLEEGRPWHEAGAHAKGHNHDSLGICLIGNHHFTFMQFYRLHVLIRSLRIKYPIIEIVAHNLLNPHKTCPNFDVDKFLGLTQV